MHVRYCKSKWLEQLYVASLLSDKYFVLRVLTYTINTASCVSFPLIWLYLMLLLQMHSLLAVLLIVSTAYGRQEVLFPDSQNVYPRVVMYQKSPYSIEFPNSPLLPRHRDRQPGQSLGQFLRTGHNDYRLLGSGGPRLGAGGRINFPGAVRNG